MGAKWFGQDIGIRGNATIRGNVTGTNFTTSFRHFYAGPAGGYHLYDVNGGTVEIFSLQADTQPATNVVIKVGAASPTTASYQVNVALATFEHLTETKFSAGVVHSNVLRPTTTGTQNNWSPTGLTDGVTTTASMIVAAPTANLTVTGISASQQDGTTLRLYNSAAFTITLNNDPLNSSTATNRFSVPNGNVILSQGDAVLLIYDGTAARWLTFYIPRGSDVQVFNANGTWTKPSGVQMVTVYLLGAGGGGGSGRKGTASILRRGGGGGGGGGVSVMTYRASALAATEAVVVGGGGNGGAGQTTASTNGNVGSNGGDTTFGGKLRAYGGPGGIAGTNSATNPADTVTAMGTLSDGTPSVYPSVDGVVVPPTPTTSRYGGAPGGPGGSISLGNAGMNGVTGGSIAQLLNSTQAGGTGSAQSNTATASVAGGAGSTPFSDLPGSGGGGSGANTSSGASGVGGAGGRGAGGGGSGGTTTGNSGAGGAGGDGMAVIISVR